VSVTAVALKFCIQFSGTWNQTQIRQLTTGLALSLESFSAVGLRLALDFTDPGVGLVFSRNYPTLWLTISEKISRRKIFQGL